MLFNLLKSPPKPISWQIHGTAIRKDWIGYCGSFYYKLANREYIRGQEEYEYWLSFLKKIGKKKRN